MNKHEVIVRGALRLYELIYTSACDSVVLRYYYTGGTDNDLQRGMLAAKAKAILAHDHHLIRMTK